jgi:hypothetical protein
LALPRQVLQLRLSILLNWPTNRWSGKASRITGGTGQGLEFAITSNSANTLVLELQQLWTLLLLTPFISQTKKWIEFSWLFGLSDASRKGKSFVIARGGLHLL